jgi:hypothetical protein
VVRLESHCLHLLGSCLAPASEFQIWVSYYRSVALVVLAFFAPVRWWFG